MKTAQTRRRVAFALLVAGLIVGFLAACNSDRASKRGSPTLGKAQSAVGECGDYQPILILKDTSAPNDKNLYQHYVAEILKTEGLAEYAEAEVSTVDAACLTTHDVVILTSLSLSTTMADLLRTYVANGGYLIGLRPDPQLADVFNVSAGVGSGHLCKYDGDPSSLDRLCSGSAQTDAGSAATCTGDAIPAGAACAWCTTAAVELDTRHPALQSLETRTMRIHGAAKKYTAIPGTSTLAALYDGATKLPNNPAITYYTNGNGGRAALFAYDLAESVVLTRQGNPYLAGVDVSGPADLSDGGKTAGDWMRPAQMFEDRRISAPTPLFEDLRLSPPASWNGTDRGVLESARNDVPQADEQMHALTNIIQWGVRATKPLPRVWYYANRERAALTISSDYESSSVPAARQQNDEISDAGGHIAQYLLDPTSVSTTEGRHWQVDGGHELSVHTLTSISPNSAITYSGMTANVTLMMATFDAIHSPTTPITTRNHELAWASCGPGGGPSAGVCTAKDPAAQARIFSDASPIRLDTTFSSYPFTYGYMTGSGLAMPFLDLCAASPSLGILPVAELATQFEDDCQHGTAYSLLWDKTSSVIRYQTALFDAWNRYHGAVNPLFHASHWLTAAEVPSMRERAQPMLQLANNLGIPIRAPGHFWDFWTRRNQVRFDSISYTAGSLTFMISNTTPGATILLPMGDEGSALQSVLVDSAPATFTLESLQGTRYGAFVLDVTGTVAVEATYGAGYKITGTVGSAAADSTVILIAGAPTSNPSHYAQIAIRPDASGAYAVASLQPGNYTVSASSSAYAFTPRSAAVTIGAGDEAADFVASPGVESPESGRSLLGTEVPEGFAAGALELGLRFRPKVDGLITQLRYWRPEGDAPSTARLWDASGTLLAETTDAASSASGWRTLPLAYPVLVHAYSSYVISANSASKYAYTHYAFKTPKSSAFLESDFSYNSGLYQGVYSTTPGTFPNTQYLWSNYFRDVVFVPGNQTVLSSEATAASVPGSVELGMIFRSSIEGEVRSVRFRDASLATGSVHAKIWDPSEPDPGSRLLASHAALVSAVTPRTRQVDLPAPVKILPDHDYIVSVDTLGGYPYLYHDFDSAKSNPPLSAPVGAGIYSNTPGAMPDQPPYLNANYHRDVVFTRAQEIMRGLAPAQSILSSAPFELGTRFSSDVAGRITAIRYYSHPTMKAGVHVGKLWTAEGRLVAAVIFQHETASGGWQEQPLDVPVLIQPGLTYIVSVNTGRNEDSTPWAYVYTTDGFASARTWRHLTVPVGGGVYAEGLGVFPSITDPNQYNYFRDVVFVPD